MCSKFPRSLTFGLSRPKKTNKRNTDSGQGEIKLNGRVKAAILYSLAQQTVIRDMAPGTEEAAR